MHLVITLPHLKAGGAERTASELANYLVVRGDTVSIVLMYREDVFFTLDPRVTVLQPEMVRSPWGKYLHTLRVILYLRSTFRSLRPDVIFALGYMALALAASWGLPTRVVISGRSSPDRVRFPGNRIANVVYRLSHRLLQSRVNGIIAQTSLAASRYRERYRCRIEVIPNFLRKLNVATAVRRKQLITVGRCDNEKGHRFLIEAFSKLTAPGWTCVIVGDGPLRTTLEAQAYSAGLHGRVLFPGFQKEIDSWLGSSSIFAFTSLHEGYPNALLEAMAAGLPCVSFDCVAGPADLINDSVNGFLVPVGDVGTLTQRIQTLIDSSDLRERVGREASAKKETHALEVIAARYRDFFLEILSRKQN